MIDFHDDDFILDDLILTAFGNKSGDDSTGKGLSLGQTVKRKLMDMVQIKKGLTVDCRWLLMFLVVKSIGSTRGLHYVAADGTRFPNVGLQLIKFVTLDGTWT